MSPGFASFITPLKTSINTGSAVRMRPAQSIFFEAGTACAANVMSLSSTDMAKLDLSPHPNVARFSGADHRRNLRRATDLKSPDFRRRGGRRLLVNLAAF